MKFRLSIVSPERVLFDDEIVSLVVPGGEGYLGILANHAPLISTLKVGEITIKTDDNRERWVATSGGFIEVSGNRATILTETAEFVDEIDFGRAQKELKRAEDLLNLNLSGSDLELAQHSREKARNRIALVKKHQ